MSPGSLKEAEIIQTSGATKVIAMAKTTIVASTRGMRPAVPFLEVALTSVLPLPLAAPLQDGHDEEEGEKHDRDR